MDVQPCPPSPAFTCRTTSSMKSGMFRSSTTASRRRHAAPPVAVRLAPGRSGGTIGGSGRPRPFSPLPVPPHWLLNGCRYLAPHERGWVSGGFHDLGGLSAIIHEKSP